MYVFLGWCTAGVHRIELRYWRRICGKFVQDTGTSATRETSKSHSFNETYACVHKLRLSKANEELLKIMSVPGTPDPTDEGVSKRQWDGKIRKWRAALTRGLE